MADTRRTSLRSLTTRRDPSVLPVRGVSGVPMDSEDNQTPNIVLRRVTLRLKPRVTIHIRLLAKTTI